ncbi:MAG: DUF5723 family protein [bacterium]
MRKLHGLCLLIGLILPWAASLGQTEFNARSVGMAGAYQGMARGADASLWNPANLALLDNPRFCMDFLNASLCLGNNSISVGGYNAYFTADYFNVHERWTNAAKEEILGWIPNQGWQVYNRAKITPLAISHKQYAIAVSSFAFGDAQLPKEAIDVALYGLGAEQVILDDLHGEAIAGTEIALAGAKLFNSKWSWAEKLALGGTFKFLIGHAYAKTETIEGSALSSVDSIALHGEYQAVLVNPFADKGETGYGFTFDLGAAAVVNERFSVGLALHNIVGGIAFNGCEEVQGSYHLEEAGLQLEELDDLEAYLDSITAAADTTFLSDRRIQYTPPRWLGLSANYKLYHNFTVELDYYQGFNQTAGGTTAPRFALGTEFWRWRMLPLRFGVGIGGVQGLTLACGWGLRLGHYQLDIGCEGQRGVFNGAKGISVALAQRIVF